MALSLEQNHRPLRTIKGLINEAGVFIEYLDQLAELRRDYGPEIVTLLDGVISPAEWQSTRDWMVARRALLIERAQAQLGDDLEALRQ